MYIFGTILTLLILRAFAGKLCPQLVDLSKIENPLAENYPAHYIFSELVDCAQKNLDKHINDPIADPTKWEDENEWPIPTKYCYLDSANILDKKLQTPNYRYPLIAPGKEINEDNVGYRETYDIWLQCLRDLSDQSGVIDDAKYQARLHESIAQRTSRKDAVINMVKRVENLLKEETTSIRYDIQHLQNMADFMDARLVF